MNAAVILPCYNEELTIGMMLDELAQYNVDVYVCDNASTDHSAEIIRNHNVKYVFEAIQGKGAAIQALWKYVKDYDVVIMFDADNTTNVSWINSVLDYYRENCVDMVIGTRPYIGNFIRCCGNRFMHWLYRKQNIQDALSGVRAFSGDFVRRYTPTSIGFTLEVELNAAAASIANLPCEYSPRVAHSHSKLKLSDSFTILFYMWRHRR